MNMSHLPNLVGFIKAIFSIGKVLKDVRFPKALWNAPEDTRMPDLTPKQFFKGIRVLWESIASRPIDIFVSLPNANLVVAGLRQWQEHFCEVYECRLLLRGLIPPAGYVQLALPNNNTTILLVPEALFALPRDINIVLVDDFWLTGIIAYTTRQALITHGFQNVTYISLVAKCGYQESMINPQAVGISRSA